MQTTDDLRLGSLVRWFGTEGTSNTEDVDDVGIVTEIHPASTDHDAGYNIYWSVTEKVNFFHVSEINDCFYENRIKVISSANSR